MLYVPSHTHSFVKFYVHARCGRYLLMLRRASILLLLRRITLSLHHYTLSFSHPEKCRGPSTLFCGACHECNVLSYSASWVLRSAGVEDVDGGYRVDEFMAQIFPPK